MYEELVKRLLTVAGGGREEKCDGCPYEEDYPCCVDCLDKLHKQAADSIEELSRIVREYQKFDGFLAAHGMFKQDPMVPIPQPPKEETE